MDTAALRQRLGDILREEERAEVDWQAVGRMCEELGHDMRDQSGLETPHIVFHFLFDDDIRAKDAIYGQQQRIDIKRFVETGECDDSKEVSPWGCLAVIAAVGALLIWIIR